MATLPNQPQATNPVIHPSIRSSADPSWSGPLIIAGAVCSLLLAYLASAMVTDTLFLRGKISPDSHAYHLLLTFYCPLAELKTWLPQYDQATEATRHWLLEPPAKSH